MLSSIFPLFPSIVSKLFSSLQELLWPCPAFQRDAPSISVGMLFLSVLTTLMAVKYVP